jgi:cbb3-type cytochrome oxidase subunit 3
VRRLLGVPTVLGATLVVLVVATAESWDGLESVAETATGIGLVLLLLTAVAVVAHLLGRRGEGRAPRAAVGVIVVVSVLLVGVVAIVTVRGHTASTRFADRADDLRLPAGYERTSTTGVDQLADGNPEHVVRAWSAPDGADACSDAQKAFEDWADPPFSTYERGGSCIVASTDHAEKAQIHVTPDDTTVVLEMWLEGSSLLSS